LAGLYELKINIIAQGFFGHIFLKLKIVMFISVSFVIILFKKERFYSQSPFYPWTGSKSRISCLGQERWFLFLDLSICIDREKIKWYGARFEAYNRKKG